MDYDPKPMPLRNPRDVLEYLAKNGIQLPPEIMEWCPLKTDVMVPSHSGVFIHPQISALGMKLSLTAFVHSVLSYFRVAPSQLTVGAWRILLGFEALYNCFLLEAC